MTIEERLALDQILQDAYRRVEDDLQLKALIIEAIVTNNRSLVRLLEERSTRDAE